jgi:hypothetical protein
VRIQVGNEPNQIWTLSIGDLAGRVTPLTVSYSWEQENYHDQVCIDLTRAHLKQIRQHIDQLLAHPRTQVQADGTGGQDRESYSDTQDRQNYTWDEDNA